MKVVILAGGMGTRLREETEFKPKPMVEIGGKPIIWHIMNRYAEFGHTEFIVCVGYKGEVIKEWFSNLRLFTSDVAMEFNGKSTTSYLNDFTELNWKVTIANTGESTATGGRLFRIRKYLNNETFLCTYGDGLANVDFSRALEFHKKHGKIATLTTVQPPSRFGVLDLEVNGAVKKFREKPQTDGWVNGGFFIFEPKIFDYLDQDSVLEQEPLARLASDGELMAHQHSGFWKTMDTYREKIELETIWDSGKIPWIGNKDSGEAS